MPTLLAALSETGPPHGDTSARGGWLAALAAGAPSRARRSGATVCLCEVTSSLSAIDGAADLWQVAEQNAWRFAHEFANHQS